MSFFWVKTLGCSSRPSLKCCETLWEEYADQLLDICIVRIFEQRFEAVFRNKSNGRNYNLYTGPTLPQDTQMTISITRNHFFRGCCCSYRYIFILQSFIKFRTCWLWLLQLLWPLISYNPCESIKFQRVFLGFTSITLSKSKVELDSCFKAKNVVSSCDGSVYQ